jgi:hypothetical protein
MIDGLDDYSYGAVEKEEFENAPRQKKDMTTACHLNRSIALRAWRAPE